MMTEVPTWVLYILLVTAGIGAHYLLFDIFWWFDHPDKRRDE